ncbi:MAG: polyprenyl synthetase family protein [Bacteroidia bacterium]|nr:polyprenyl synthetase family protein [Bacteroidia bacterium]
MYFPDKIQSLSADFEAVLKSYIQTLNIKTPSSLYEPEKYILSMGGKRIRPILSLLAAESEGNSCKSAMHVALCIELFHNFSLIHDDIMDQAPLRRGHPTVHLKWNLPVAILCGDNMLIHSLNCLLNYPSGLSSEMMEIFLSTAEGVCEGQQMDMDFENQPHVHPDEYIRMISQKTGILLGCALTLGSMAARGKKENRQHFFEFGKNLGISFQILDDYLDAFSEPEESGKVKGGDFLAGKKSMPHILADANLKGKALSEWENFKRLEKSEKQKNITKIIAVLESENIAFLCKEAAAGYAKKAEESLKKLNISFEYKKIFSDLSAFLLQRKK